MKDLDQLSSAQRRLYQLHQSIDTIISQHISTHHTKSLLITVSPNLFSLSVLLLLAFFLFLFLFLSLMSTALSMTDDKSPKNLKRARVSPASAPSCDPSQHEVKSCRGLAICALFPRPPAGSLASQSETNWRNVMKLIYFRDDILGMNFWCMNRNNELLRDAIQFEYVRVEWKMEELNEGEPPAEAYEDSWRPNEDSLHLLLPGVEYCKEIAQTIQLKFDEIPDINISHFRADTPDEFPLPTEDELLTELAERFNRHCNDLLAQFPRRVENGRTFVSPAVGSFFSRLPLLAVGGGVTGSDSREDQHPANPDYRRLDPTDRAGKRTIRKDGRDLGFQFFSPAMMELPSFALLLPKLKAHVRGFISELKCEQENMNVTEFHNQLKDAEAEMNRIASAAKASTAADRSPLADASSYSNSNWRAPIKLSQATNQPPTLGPFSRGRHSLLRTLRR